MRSHVAFPAPSWQLCWPQQGDGSKPCKHPRSLSGAASRQGARGEHLTYVSRSGHENRAPACTSTCGIWQTSPGKDQQPCLVASAPGEARGTQGWPWSAKMEESLRPAHAGKNTSPARPASAQHLLHARPCARCRRQQRAGQKQVPVLGRKITHPCPTLWHQVPLESNNSKWEGDDPAFIECFLYAKVF